MTMSNSPEIDYILYENKRYKVTCGTIGVGENSRIGYLLTNKETDVIEMESICYPQVLQNAEIYNQALEDFKPMSKLSVPLPPKIMVPQ